MDHAGSGYNWDMRFRLGLAAGLATGYYLGARAGRRRYDQINRTLARLRRSGAVEAAADRAKAVVDDGVGKARSAIEHRLGHDDHDAPDVPVATSTNGHGAGIILPTDPPTGLGGYSSSR